MAAVVIQGNKKARAPNGHRKCYCCGRHMPANQMDKRDGRYICGPTIITGCHRRLHRFALAGEQTYELPADF